MAKIHFRILITIIWAGQTCPLYTSFISLMIYSEKSKLGLFGNECIQEGC